MWAPFAVWKNENTAYLYYGHGVQMSDEFFTLRMLVAHAPDLETWKPYTGNQLQYDNVAFVEPDGHDACIFWDKNLAAYIMYYAAKVPTDNSSELEGVIRARTSRDLLKWSQPHTVLPNAPLGYNQPESPFVLHRNGYYYLWVSGFDYGRMSLYISEDPFNFGHPDKNRVTEQSGHAPEIVTIDGTDYIACAAIASDFGNKPAVHDLWGVFIQKLDWAEPTNLIYEKITRKTR